MNIMSNHNNNKKQFEWVSDRGSMIGIEPKTPLLEPFNGN